MSDNLNQASQDAKEQIAQLRDQVQTLMSERVTPALSQAADTAQQYASQARDSRMRTRPRCSPSGCGSRRSLAVLLAAGVGYIVGRIAR